MISAAIAALDHFWDEFSWPSVRMKIVTDGLVASPLTIAAVFTKASPIPSYNAVIPRGATCSCVMGGTAVRSAFSWTVLKICGCGCDA